MSDEFAVEPRRRMVPKGVASLILGISACQAGWAYGIPGIICGIIGLSLSRQARAALDANPTLYHGERFVTEGRTWSIVGIVQGVILTFAWILYIVFIIGIVTHNYY